MGSTTPMMAQYRKAKSQHPDALLFFRMGDFYELFEDDAKLVSRVLGLTLTSRDKANPIPMAGMPVRAVDTYLRRLLRQGYRVAICEQVQDPREATGLVEREVIRVVTPGTVTEDAVLDARANNYLAAAFASRDRAGLAWVDLSTGGFLVSDLPAPHLLDELGRVDPSELLVPESFAEEHPEELAAMREATGAVLTLRPDWTFGKTEALRALTGHFGVRSLDGFGCGDLDQALNAAGSVFQYVTETQRTELSHITRLTKIQDGSFLIMDRATRRALEITAPMSGEDRGSTLLGVLDRTRTAMGARRLKSWLLAPLVDPVAIRRRHGAVEELVDDGFRRQDLREALKAVNDLERIAGKLATGRVGPRDLVSLRQSAEALPRLRERLEDAYTEELASAREAIDPLSAPREQIARAVRDDPAPTIKDGGIIREGFSPELDELRSLRRDGKAWIADFQQREAERTGISTLKIGYNRVFGYYIEVTHANRERVPPDYHRKQTLKNAERYITPELKEHETRVLTADEKAKDLETELFLALRAELAAHVPAIQAVADAVATVDALAALAEAASAHGYIRPEVHDGDDLVINEGRHPVLERLQTDEPFVPNDIHMGAEERRVLVITGPNMSGKSTYLRQTALIVLMAQCGSFVPARSASVGICDRIFTRVGAADDLSQGKSTFMVEMSETANILNNATRRSLLVLDEIGRGTSTYDGVAIAWAVTEHIATKLLARTLFATHYHELTAIAETRGNVTNLNVAVREWKDEVVFLRKIQEGGTDRSYGIHVARIAGVPRTVIDRAGEILARLEGAPVAAPSHLNPREQQLPLFAAAPHPVLAELRKIDPDHLAPVDALLELKRLVERLRTED